MATPQISTKRLAITKANAQTVAVVAIASFISIFCLVAAHAVWSQNAYQSRVISAKQKANDQLNTNLKAVSNLMASYKTFVSTPTNVIGGNPNGTGQNDGDNAKIILDALPSTYDFPALTSSLEQILTSGNYKINSISGTDDELNQQANTTSPNPQPVSMPFTFSISNANYASIQQLINQLQVSIRPIQIDSITLTGGGNNMQLSVTAHTFYQPGKSLTITKKVIR